VAVICDTQNYVDHNNQREAGFPLNAREMLWDMMSHIARNARSNGGDIAFATGLGDNWQHPSVAGPDAQHAATGAAANPVIERILPASPDALREVEMPAVRRAWKSWRRPCLSRWCRAITIMTISGPIPTTRRWWPRPMAR
jgi:hypothetical protein